MDNPYEPSIETPVLPSDDRMRWSNWRRLLLAYGVHHAAGAAGIVTGWLVSPDKLRFAYHEGPGFWFKMLAFIPVLDFAFVLQPFVLDGAFPLNVVWYVRCLAVLTIPFAIVAYGTSRHSAYLCYLGIVSYLIFVSNHYTLLTARG